MIFRTISKRIVAIFAAAILTNAPSFGQGGGLDAVKDCLLRNNPESALLTLESLSTDSLGRHARTRDLYAGIANFGINRFDSAHHYFRSALTQTDTVSLNRLDSMFAHRSWSVHPSPAVALAMSAVVPGSGQWYAGRPFDGLNSIGLLAGLTGMTMAAPGVGYMTVPMFSRYYLGGIKNAVDQANLMRALRRNRQLLTILDMYEVSTDLKTALTMQPVGQLNYFRDVRGKQMLDKGLSMALASYKQFVSSQDGDVCVFEPSCSVYMVQALRQEGVFIGYLDGIDRLLRCRPFMNQGTKDPLAVSLALDPPSGKSPWLAAVSSGLIPGLGKVYTGEWKDGLYACAMVSAFSWLAYRSAHKGSVPYTALYGSMALSLYLGNVYGSWKSAVKHCR